MNSLFDSRSSLKVIPGNIKGTPEQKDSSRGTYALQIILHISSDSFICNSNIARTPQRGQ